MWEVGIVWIVLEKRAAVDKGWLKDGRVCVVNKEEGGWGWLHVHDRGDGWLGEVDSCPVSPDSGPFFYLRLV